MLLINKIVLVMLLPPFTNPGFDYIWNQDQELQQIKAGIADANYGIPKPGDNQLLIGTWNIANFDVQNRDDSFFPMIAEIIKPFDIMAIQEVKANLEGFNKLLQNLGDEFSYVFTDIGGNWERLCYLYKNNKVKQTPHIGELDIPQGWRKRWYWMGFPAEEGEIDNDNDGYVERNFLGFDRNPFIVTWEFNETKFTTYNCHIYYGDEKEDELEKFRRRILELFAIIKWVKGKVHDHPEKIFSSNIIILGDLNTPSMKEDDEVFQELDLDHFVPLDYTDHLIPESNIKESATYDQMVVIKPFAEKIQATDFKIFAWDRFLFKELWGKLLNEHDNNCSKAASEFQKFAKWAISDHRPLWALYEFT